MPRVHHISSIPLSNSLHLPPGFLARILNKNFYWLQDRGDEMGFLVPILRLISLFIHIYDTYKVLKIPAPSESAHNGDQPSAWAMVQRKRNMEGFVTIWAVWVCLDPLPCAAFPLLITPNSL